MPFIIRPGKARRFDHIPIYYDKEKEEFEERVNKIKEKMERNEKGEYLPSFKGQFGRPKSRYSLWFNPKKNKSFRGRSIFYVINIFLVVAIIYLAFKLIPYLVA